MMKFGAQKLFSKNLLILAIAGIIALVSLVAAFYFYTQNQKTLATMGNPTEFARLETEKLITAVGRLMELPIGEEPTVATITDHEKLKSQQFFANSQNGDKVIIYTEAKRAILYRPGTNKIIDVAPINLGTESATLQTTPSQNEVSAKVALLNGTTTVGLTRTYETELKTKTPGVQVVVRENAKKQDFAKTILVDISGTKTALANTLARSLGISVEKLPEGENASVSADFLIIVGEDNI